MSEGDYKIRYQQAFQFRIFAVSEQDHNNIKRYTRKYFLSLLNMNQKLMKLVFCFLCMLMLFTHMPAMAQKRVLSYPFKLGKTALKRDLSDAHFFVDNSLDVVSFIIHDDKRADYVLTDQNLKIKRSFSVPLDQTIFQDGKEEYLGGSALPGSDVFNFVYKVSPKKDLFASGKDYYRVETVNFKENTITQKELLQIPSEEKMVASYSDYGEYFAITANDRTSELIIHKLAGNGEVFTKNLAFPIPPGKGKSRDKLSEYLKDTRLIKEDEETEMETAGQSSKLFSSKNDLRFIINDNASPTQIATIDKIAFTLTSKFSDLSSLYTEKENNYVNAYQADDKLFSLLLNKKGVEVIVSDLKDGSILKQQAITAENMNKVLSVLPTYEERKGDKKKEEDIDSYGELIKRFTKGTDGLMVVKNA
jgi:hypothetical protein